MRSIAFSADGKLLASGSDDMTAHLWQLDAQNAEPVVLRGHQGIVIALAFSRAGKPVEAIQDFTEFIKIAAQQPNAGENLLLAQQWIDEMQQEPRGSPTPTP